MYKTILTIALATIISTFSLAQETNQTSDLTIIFDAGLMLGHTESHYPAPFSSNISFLKKINNEIWLGAGSGAEVLGKTFIPIYADFRIIPIKSKPLFLYNKLGYTFCANKNYSENNNEYSYYPNYPHPLNESVKTKGGFMNEAGFGIIMKKRDWNTSVSIGYRYQKTEDEYDNNYKRTYQYIFNRLAVRVGFWF